MLPAWTTPARRPPPLQDRWPLLPRPLRLPFATPRGFAPAVPVRDEIRPFSGYWLSLQCPVMDNVWVAADDDFPETRPWSRVQGGPRTEAGALLASQRGPYGRGRVLFTAGERVHLSVSCFQYPSSRPPVLDYTGW